MMQLCSLKVRTHSLVPNKFMTLSLSEVEFPLVKIGLLQKEDIPASRNLFHYHYYALLNKFKYPCVPSFGLVLAVW